MKIVKPFAREFRRLVPKDNMTKALAVIVYGVASTYAITGMVAYNPKAAALGASVALLTALGTYWLNPREEDYHGE